MDQLSYRRHRFPSPIIQHAIWLYLRFTLSYRDVEELLAERGLAASYETVRRWVLRFGPGFARRLRRSHPRTLDPRRDPAASRPPSTTRSFFNDSSSLGPPCGSSEPKQRRSARVLSQQHETRFV